MTGARAVVDALRALGVEVVFGLPGVHNLPLWSVLRRSRRSGCSACVTSRRRPTRPTATRGRPAGSAWRVVTTGPGAANTLGAVGEAWASGSPVLLIATDIPTTLRRAGTYRGTLHECVDQAGMFGPVTKGVPGNRPRGGPDAGRDRAPGCWR